MTENKSPYDTAITELEARRTQIDNAITALKQLREAFAGVPWTNLPLVGDLTSTGTVSTVVTRGGASSETDNIPRDAFFKMTIADAAVKYLNKWANRKPRPTNEIIDALERGGLKRKAYTTVYAILSRRARDKRDVVNVNGDWGLHDWYAQKNGREETPEKSA